MEHLQYLHVDTVIFIARHFGCRILHLEQYGFREAENAQRVVVQTIGARLSPLRRHLKCIPGVRSAVYALRMAQTRSRSAFLPPRESGDYHLFAVLQIR